MYTSRRRPLRWADSPAALANALDQNPTLRSILGTLGFNSKLYFASFLLFWLNDNILYLIWCFPFFSHFVFHISSVKFPKIFVPRFVPPFFLFACRVGAERGHGPQLFFPWASFGQRSQIMWRCFLSMLGFRPIYLYYWNMLYVIMYSYCIASVNAQILYTSLYIVVPWLTPKFTKTYAFSLILSLLWHCLLSMCCLSGHWEW